MVAKFICDMIHMVKHSKSIKSAAEDIFKFCGFSYIDSLTTFRVNHLQVHNLQGSYRQVGVQFKDFSRTSKRLSYCFQRLKFMKNTDSTSKCYSALLKICFRKFV